MRATPTDPAREIEQAGRLELGLILVRTFSVFLGFYLILETMPVLRPTRPTPCWRSPTP